MFSAYSSPCSAAMTPPTKGPFLPGISPLSSSWLGNEPASSRCAEETDLEPPTGFEPACVQLPFLLVRSQRGYEGKTLVVAERLELSTSPFAGVRSIQLSYATKFLSTNHRPGLNLVSREPHPSDAAGEDDVTLIRLCIPFTIQPPQPYSQGYFGGEMWTRTTPPKGTVLQTACLEPPALSLRNLVGDVGFEPTTLRV